MGGNGKQLRQLTVTTAAAAAATTTAATTIIHRNWVVLFMRFYAGTLLSYPVQLGSVLKSRCSSSIHFHNTNMLHLGSISEWPQTQTNLENVNVKCEMLTTIASSFPQVHLSQSHKSSLMVI